MKENLYRIATMPKITDVSSIIYLVVFLLLQGCNHSDDKAASAPIFSNLFSEFVTLVSDGAPIAVSIGDINSDGRNDVVMISGFELNPSTNFKLYLFLQNADGTLGQAIKLDTKGSLTNPLSGLTIGDVNNDGKNEVIVGHLYKINSTGSIEIFRQDPVNILVSDYTVPSNLTSLIQTSDVNNDGLPDVVSVDDVGSIGIHIQINSAVLDPAQIFNVSHDGFDDLDIGDVNSDNLNDVIVMSGQGFSPNFGILHQKDTGFDLPTYYNITEGMITNSLTVSDLNNDGRKDVAVSFGSFIGIFFQNQFNVLGSNVTYQSLDPLSHSGSIKAHDLNSDGKNDIVALQGSSNTIETYLQESGNSFVQEQYLIPTTQSINKNAIAVEDINQDTRPDIVIASDSGVTILYQK